MRGRNENSGMTTGGGDCFTSTPLGNGRASKNQMSGSSGRGKRRPRLHGRKSSMMAFFGTLHALLLACDLLLDEVDNRRNSSAVNLYKSTTHSPSFRLISTAQTTQASWDNILAVTTKWEARGAVFRTARLPPIRKALEFAPSGSQPSARMMRRASSLPRRSPPLPVFRFCPFMRPL